MVKERPNALGRELQRISSQLDRYQKLLKIKAPSIIIENTFGVLDRTISRLAHSQIDFLQDEVLANFDGLIAGDVSTETKIGMDLHKTIGCIDQLFEPYKDVPELYSRKDGIDKRFRMELSLFFDTLTRMFFMIRKFPEFQEDARMLLYIHGTKGINDIEEYLQKKIGNNLYGAYKSIHEVESPDNFLKRKIIKRQKLDVMSFSFLEMTGKSMDYYKRSPYLSTSPDGKLHLKKKYMSENFLR